MKQVFKKIQMWMIALVAMFAFGSSAFAQAPDATCTFPNDPWPWNGALNRVAWTDNGVTFSARGMNIAETGVEVSYAKYGEPLYIESAEKTIVKMVFNETSAPIVANVGTIEGNVWTGSATNIEIYADYVSTDITYVEVYFEGSTPQPAEYKTGESVSEGELDKNTPLVYLYFTDHEIESVDATQITVGGEAIAESQLGFWGGDNFYVVFSNAMPLAAGDYTVVIPEGAIKFVDGKINEAITLVYTVPSEAVIEGGAVCTFPNDPWPWNGALNRVAWADNGVTFSASCMNLAETGVEVSNSESGQALYIDSEKTIVKMVFNETSAPIVANVGTIEGNVWTGSATNIEIYADYVSTDITYVEVYFEEEEAPAQPEPEVGADATISFLETDPSCQYYSSEKGAYWWKSNGVSAWGDAWVDDSYCYFSATEKIYVTSDEKNIGKIELIGANDVVVYTWTGSAKSVDLGEGAISKLVYSVKVYFEQTAPAPETANYLTGKSVEEGELDAQNSSLVYLYFNDHEIESVDATQITVGGQAAPSVGFWGGDNFYVILADVVPLPAGDYTVVVPEGAVVFKDGKVNEAITLVYTVTAAPAAPETVNYLTGQSVEEGELDANYNPLVYLYFNDHEIESVDAIQITVGGQSIETWQLGFWPNYNPETFSITFGNAMPLVPGDYTIVIPEGAIKFVDGKVNETITLVYTVTSEAVIEGDAVCTFPNDPWPWNGALNRVAWTDNGVTFSASCMNMAETGVEVSNTEGGQPLYIDSEKTIVKMVFNETSAPIVANVGTIEGNVWTGSATNIEIYAANVSTDITYVEVYFESEEENPGQEEGGEPDATISFLETDPSCQYYSSEKGAYWWKSNGVSVWGDTWMEDSYCYFSATEKIYVTSDETNIGKIELIGANDVVVYTWTGSSKEVELVGVDGPSVKVYSVKVYFAETAPAQPETLDAVLSLDGEVIYVTLPKQAAWSDAFGEGYDNVLPEGLTVTGVDNNSLVAVKVAWYNWQSDQLAIQLVEALTAAGTYTVNIPAGFIYYSNEELNEAYTATFTIEEVPAEPITVDVVLGFKYVNVTLPVTTTDYNAWGWTWGEFVGEIPAGLEVLDPNGEAVAIKGAFYNYNTTLLQIELEAEPTAAGEYTVNVPAGVVTGLDEALIGTFTVAAPVEYINVIEYAWPEAGEIALDAFEHTGGLYIFTTENFDVVEGASATVNGEEAFTMFYGTDKSIFVSLPNPLEAGKTYTVVIPAGCLKIGDKYNEEITLVYTTAPAVAEVANYGVYVYVTLPIVATDFQYWDGYNGEIPAGLEVLDPNGDAVAVKGAWYNYDSDIFCIQLVDVPSSWGGEYTVNVPAGLVTGLDVALTGTFAIAPDIETVTLVGEAALCGNEWDEMDEEGVNALTPNEDATVWTITKENVALVAWRDYEYKVVFNHNWNFTWPRYNYGDGDFYVEESGIYNVTFTYSVADDYVTVTYERQPDPMRGDLNGDDLVNVGDYTTEIDIILENIQPTSLQRVQADVNKDGRVNVGDVTSIVNIILERDTQTSVETRAAAAPAFFNLAATLISTENGIRRYALSLDGAAIANFQMDLRLAEGTTLVGKTIGERSNGHYLYGNATADGTERLLAASLMGNNLNGNAGNICYIDVAGEGEIEISDVIVADAAGRTHDVAGLVIGSETGINGIAADKAGSTIYSLDGRRTSRMNAGIYVNEGRKTIVK